jgi:tRNA pseudouridine55 synthase
MTNVPDGPQKEATAESSWETGEVLLIDKPFGWTSFDVVAKVRRLCGVKKVGHAGTLDPLATGLLIVCTGRKTKEIDQFSGLDKHYEAEILLGATTRSFDAETPVESTAPTDGITKDMILSVLERFVGPQEQYPPMFSAAKVKGKPLYKYARKGREVDRKAREIVVYGLDLVSLEIPTIVVGVRCSKGTYVRSLANDIGQVLGCGAYLKALRRTRIGDFDVRNAVSIEALGIAIRGV